MRRLLIVPSVILIFVFGLFGCGTNNNSEGNASGEPKVTDESMKVNDGRETINNSEENISGDPKITNEYIKVDDFKVSINVKNGEKDINVFATITYMGEETEIDIYHGGSIFFFNVYQQDGDFEYIGAMNQPLLTTTLIRNEPHRVDFNAIEKLNLKSGTYELEAIADFSLDSDDVVGTKIRIPVSIVEEIE